MANRLAHETSPYLLQHAHNPVDWYPWGEEALEKAKEEDKPILLSIGYSACHWCHVMERESFENIDIARTMNESFVSIKVDREERPDLDSIYMQAVQALTGQGGWPMTVFLTPQGEPFYGGTYFPPEDRGGMPGFHRILKTMDEVYRTRRGDVGKATSELVNRLQPSSRMKSNKDLLTKDVLNEAFLHLASGFDEQNGGFGDAPKFPQPMIYDFLLRYHHSTNNEKAIQMLNLSLEKMALGGMYDQLGGGFHRYSTDSYWLVPHFEKMLYDNALLSRLYLHAFQATGHDLYLRIVQETLDYVLREMTDEDGGFYSSQDADSEGEEGKFFVWTPKEVEDALGEEDAGIFNAYYDVTSVGNFEEKSILNVPRDAETVTDELDVTPERLEEVLQRGKKVLLEVRDSRVSPGRDDKILTAWNGLMLRSFAEAAAVFHREDYRHAAIANATFIIRSLQEEGRLLRTYRDGQAKLKGYLEDYSFLADGLMAVYELTFDQRWLDEARRLVDDMVDLFWEENEGVFYDTGKDHETLLVRPRELFDNAIPSGSSVAVEVLLRMALLTGEEEYRRKATETLRSMGPLLSQYANGMGRWLAALGFYLHQPKEVAIVGSLESRETKALLEVVHEIYLPNKVVVGMEEDDPMGSNPLPLLRFRTKVQGAPVAYVCENYVCQLPVTDPEDLADRLDG
jgi:uncharacterized protein YyaL (SSP411 family)